MLRKAVCPECGSSNIKVQTYVRMELDLVDAQQEIDKDIINKENTRVIDANDSPITIVYCGECYHEISREVDLGEWFKNKDLTDELCKRLDTLEQFRTDTFAKEFRAEIDRNDRMLSGGGCAFESNYTESADSIELDYHGLLDDCTEESDEAEDGTEDSSGITWDYSEE